eukprot:gene26025-biopygen13058
MQNIDWAHDRSTPPQYIWRIGVPDGVVRHYRALCSVRTGQFRVCSRILDHQYFCDRHWWRRIRKILSRRMNFDVAALIVALLTGNLK